MTLTRATQISLFGLVLATVFVGSLLLAPEFAQATSAADTIAAGLEATGNETYGSSNDITTIIGNLIGVILSLTGIIFLVITVYAGVLYMTAAGEADKIKKAKGMLVSSLIGIVIIISAYALTSFIVGALSEAI